MSSICTLFCFEPNTFTEHRRKYRLPLSVLILPNESCASQPTSTCLFLHRTSGEVVSIRAPLQHKARTLRDRTLGCMKPWRALMEEAIACGHPEGTRVFVFSPAREERKAPNLSEEVDLVNATNQFHFGLYCLEQRVVLETISLTSKKRRRDSDDDDDSGGDCQAAKRRRDSDDDDDSGGDCQAAKRRRTAPDSMLSVAVPFTTTTGRGTGEVIRRYEIDLNPASQPSQASELPFAMPPPDDPDMSQLLDGLESSLLLNDQPQAADAPEPSLSSPNDQPQAADGLELSFEMAPLCDSGQSTKVTDAPMSPFDLSWTEPNAPANPDGDWFLGWSFSNMFDAMAAGQEI
jgi:hypothetical protein